MRRRLALAAVTLAAAALSACAGSPGARETATAAAPAAPAAASAASAPAGDFSLYELPSTWRDQRGAAVRLRDLAGTPRLVAMVYTSCHAACPLIVADLKRVEASLPADRRDDVGFVLVSLDPERDTPGRLAEWAARTGLSSARWTLLSGADDDVRELAAAIGVRYRRVSPDDLAHSNTVTLLDAAGTIVHQQSTLEGTDETIRRARLIATR